MLNKLIKRTARRVQTTQILRRFSETKNEEELKKFDNINDWWDLNGTMKGLHHYNPLRIDFIRKSSIRQNLVSKGHNFLKGKTVMDVGSGGGIFVEGISRFGPERVVGLDANKNCVRVANAHKEKQRGLGENIEYVNGLLEDYNKSEGFEIFDIVTAFEIVEHVDNPGIFVDELANSVKQGGLVVMSSMYKNEMAKFLTITLAEDIFGVVDPGTHDYEKYVNLDDLGSMAEDAGLEMVNSRNTFYDILNGRWIYADHIDTNYLVCFRKL